MLVRLSQAWFADLGPSTATMSASHSVSACHVLELVTLVT